MQEMNMVCPASLSSIKLCPHVQDLINCFSLLVQVMEDQPYSQTLLEFIIQHYPQLFNDSGNLVTTDKAQKMEAALSSWMGDEAGAGPSSAPKDSKEKKK